jgi:hypothetical protein
MIGLLRGELIKLRTTRTILGFLLVMIGLMLLSVLLQTLVGDPTSLDDQRSAIAVGGTIPAVLTIFGVVGATGEHRHGTITSALLIAPDRIRVTLSKLIAYAVAGAVIGLIVQLLAFLIGIPLLSSPRAIDAADAVAILAGTVAASALSAALGVAVGALVRNQVAAVVAALAYLFIIEPILSAVVGSVYGYLIGGSTSALAGLDFTDALSPPLSALVLLGWTLAFGAAAVLADRARDVN